MENPFQLLNEKLDNILSLLNERQKELPNNEKASKRVMGIKEASQFLGIAKPTLYVQTAKRIIPHYTMFLSNQR